MASIRLALDQIRWRMQGQFLAGKRETQRRWVVSRKDAKAAKAASESPGLAWIIRGAMPIEAQPLRSEGKAGLP
ncbi:MAG TPA: hypothetical protein VLA17_17225 [Candidatus Limnocylindria bacterium]|nr:hypothetical protein [Candidatus Limnocylindria bacterium]